MAQRANHFQGIARLDVGIDNGKIGRMGFPRSRCLPRSGNLPHLVAQHAEEPPNALKQRPIFRHQQHGQGSRVHGARRPRCGINGRMFVPADGPPIPSLRHGPAAQEPVPAPYCIPPHLSRLGDAGQKIEIAPGRCVRCAWRIHAMVTIRDCALPANSNPLVRVSRSTKPAGLIKAASKSFVVGPSLCEP